MSLPRLPRKSCVLKITGCNSLKLLKFSSGSESLIQTFFWLLEGGLLKFGRRLYALEVEFDLAQEKARAGGHARLADAPRVAARGGWLRQRARDGSGRPSLFEARSLIAQKHASIAHACRACATLTQIFCTAVRVGRARTRANNSCKQRAQ